MARVVATPTVIEAAGNKPKKIEEFIGRVNSGTDAVSIARMTSPAGWVEPGQRPQFDEYTLVMEGELVVATEGETHRVGAVQAIIVAAGEWVQYSTPQGASYIAVCLPAFSPETVHRDAD